MKNYYNTNDLKGKQLSKAINKTKTQDRLVMGIVNELTKNNQQITNRIIWSRMPHGTQLTSVRRSVSNLVDIGLLTYRISIDGIIVAYKTIRRTCTVEGFETTERLIFKV